MTTVTLSIFAGVGAQLFDNNGDPLSGGKIYTYAAGTTTPQATYTSSTGGTPHANPIILDAAGRIATGEIWLTSGVEYKFVIKTSADVLIGTYDNVYGINSANAADVVYAPPFTSSVSTTVGAKLSEIPSVKDFGAIGNGSADDTAAIQAAINACNAVYFPPGTYKITSKLTVNTNNKTLVGAGIGVSILRNYGADYALEIASLGGLNPTIIGGHLADIEIDGLSTGKGLRMYDVAQFRVERVKCHDSTTDGARLEMIIDCTFLDCVSIDNAIDGFALLDSSKNGVEFNSNAIQFYGCVAYGNANAGIRIRRSRGNVVIGGEYSANDYNVLIDGGERNSITSAWIENATTRAMQINSSTSALGVLYSGNNNKITECMISTGAGIIQIANGNSNYVSGNYIGVNFQIDVSATLTYVGAQAGLIGTITDNGSGTINLSTYTAQYYKVSGLKRYQLNIGSTVDITSDIKSIRLGFLKGLSSTGTLANNITGFVDITGAATSAAVTFSPDETDTAYNVLFGVWQVAGTPASGSEAVYMTSRSTTGFTINVRTAPGVGNTVRVFWLLVR